MIVVHSVKSKVRLLNMYFYFKDILLLWNTLSLHIYKTTEQYYQYDKYQHYHVR